MGRWDLWRGWRLLRRSRDRRARIFCRFHTRPYQPEHADGERGGELHVGGGSAGKADDGDTGDGDERGVEVASGAESTHVKKDKNDEGEGGGRGWETGRSSRRRRTL